MLLHRMFSTKFICTVHVLIKVAIDLWYHGVLTLDEFFVYDKYFSKEHIPCKTFPNFFIAIIQRVPPVSLTLSVCSHYSADVASTLTYIVFPAVAFEHLIIFLSEVVTIYL